MNGVVYLKFDDSATGSMTTMRQDNKILRAIFTVRAFHLPIHPVGFTRRTSASTRRETLTPSSFLRALSFDLAFGLAFLASLTSLACAAVVAGSTGG